MGNGDFSESRGRAGQSYRHDGSALAIAVTPGASAPARLVHLLRCGKIMMAGLGALAGLATPMVADAAPPKEVVPLPSAPDLGKAEGRCRANESGPAFIVSAVGLKDRAGHLKLEVYPSNDTDWLQDDNILLYHGKTFRRVEEVTPQNGTPELCIRVPAPGPYSLMLLHDRNSDHKFQLSQDGVGFGGNPRMGWGKPRAAAARVVAGPGLTRITIVLNYFHGLSMSPIHGGD